MDEYSPAQKELFRILDIISLERTEDILKAKLAKKSHPDTLNSANTVTENDDNVID